MNLYEINAEIEKCLIEAMDPETGEIIGDYLDADTLEALEMEKDQKVENIAKWIKNLKSDAEALKTEKLKLADRQRKAENKIESLTRYLEAALAGEKFKSNDGTVDIRYRKSKKLVAAEGRSEAEIAADLVTNGFLDMVKVKAPELNKTALKAAILKGQEFDGLEVIETQSMQIG